MRIPTELYRPSLALLTDLYQLTMACAAWRSGVAEQEAVFHLFFRRNPFGGGFALACGIDPALEYLSALRFDEEDLAYLRTLQGANGGPLFDAGFLDYLRELPLQLDVDAVPEGTAVFPQEPLLRVRGPVVACMLAETPVLNLVNFQTLVATKAARMNLATRGEPILEFGLRRAQGIDGALAASRAAYVGGCAATSNVLAGRLFGIPVAGTHAHSWVMLFDDELESFDAYARALPNNCVFLVDTYDSLEGVRHAIAVGRRLRERGHRLLGVRLDSGDLAALSLEARRLLDEAGFPEARIYASNDLDERVIESLKSQGAAIAVWGVGTRLVTAHDDPALGGVYKLSAIRRPGEPWRYRLKLSEQIAKSSTPGVLQVRRFRVDGHHFADAVWDEAAGWRSGHERIIIDPLEMTRRTQIPAHAEASELLVPALRGGERVLAPEPLAQTRARAQAELEALPAGVRRFLNPHLYPVGLEPGLHELKLRMLLEARRPKP